MKKLLEWTLTLLGAAVCILVTLIFAGAQDEMWPTPGLYLAEIALLGLLGIVSMSQENRLARLAPWGISGVLLTFYVLGGFSIGPSLLPALLAFLAVALLRHWGDGPTLRRGIGLALAAALLQAAVMFAAIFLLTPGVQW